MSIKSQHVSIEELLDKVSSYMSEESDIELINQAQNCNLEDLKKEVKNSNKK